MGRKLLTGWAAAMAVMALGDAMQPRVYPQKERKYSMQELKEMAERKKKRKAQRNARKKNR